MMLFYAIYMPEFWEGVGVGLMLAGLFNLALLIKFLREVHNG
jgi:hypothetical protein